MVLDGTVEPCMVLDSIYTYGAMGDPTSIVAPALTLGSAVLSSTMKGSTVLSSTMAPALTLTPGPGPGPSPNPRPYPRPNLYTQSEPYI